MAKYRFDGDGRYDYPFLTLTAFPGGVADLANAPDAWWTEMDPGEPVTIEPWTNSPRLPVYYEPETGSIYTYDAELNRASFVPADTVFDGYSSDVSTVNGQSSDEQGNVQLVKGDIGLGNVDNTSDKLKPLSDASHMALDAKANALEVSSAISSAVNGIMPEGGTIGQILTKLTEGNGWADPAAVSVPDATSGAKGAVQLAGDLAGTASSPTVPGLADRLAKAQNLSDLANVTTARTNLGLGSAALVATSAFDTAGAATSAVNAHKGASDPHGDRSYADAQVSNRVVGDGITTIEKLTQSAYNGLTPDASTLYVIVG